MSKEKAQELLAEKAIAYRRVFDSPDGKKLLDDLQRQFGGTTLKKAPDGTIDSNASLASAGAREVILYIDYWRNRDAST
jgi:hypothetical protein